MVNKVSFRQFCLALLIGVAWTGILTSNLRERRDGVISQLLLSHISGLATEILEVHRPIYREEALPMDLRGQGATQRPVTVI